MPASMPHETLSEAMRITWVFASIDLPAMPRSSSALTAGEAPGKLSSGTMVHDTPPARQAHCGKMERPGTIKGPWLVGSARYRGRDGSVASEQAAKARTGDR